ncbi:hypothetical protein [Enterococcus mundtii]|uniref:YxeA family protein n=1 Tax=Enterococcus mundtii TaxID=53346 RepID=A0A2S7RTE6_ENTMU|nr:hypothetical protein [Enterococcus mundtii]PQF22954.1 hypothetical protein CUS89_09605 [Enterococcus mundtii]
MKLQNRTLKKLSILILLVVGVISSFLYVTSRFDSLNKFNPLVKMQVGYAIVPEKVTYNGGKEYADDGKRQIPDDYENIEVINSTTMKIEKLTFKGGQAPENHNYVKVRYKGSYVYKITFITDDSVPSDVMKVIRKNKTTE